MFDVFKKYLSEKTIISDSELDKIREFSFEKKLRKKQFLLQEGDVCRNIGFITKGCVRMFRISNDGAEHTVQFGIENWWTFDRESFFSGTPSKWNIEALEDSELLMWQKDNYQNILDEIPAYRTFREQLLRKDAIVKEERLFLNISQTSEEKYQHFINQYPNIFNRVPIYIIASYLGLTRKTLGRIRNQYANKLGK